MVDLDLKQLNSANVNSANQAATAATAAAMLAANGYSAAFPFLQHLSAAAAVNSGLPNSLQNNSSSHQRCDRDRDREHQQQQQQQLVAAAAALGLPTLPTTPTTNRYVCFLSLVCFYFRFEIFSKMKG